MVTWQNNQMYENMTSSKGVRTRNHIHMFLRISLVLKIYPNTGQTPGTTAKGRRKIWLSLKGGPF